MCNYAAPKQFAYIDMQDRFQRLKTPITSKDRMRGCIDAIPHKAVYESVYGWTGWEGGQLTAEISKTAIVDCIFLDFDDKDDPQKAIRDAAEVAAYVGHCICNFSGAKGAHVMIHCHAVDLIPDLKGHVIRQFVNNLVDVLHELDTLDFAVVGDTSRVRRIIDSVHPKYKLHAIGLTAEELATKYIEEIMGKAMERRGLVQVPKPSQWVTDELYRIEEDILVERLDKLRSKGQLSHTSYHYAIRYLSTRTTLRDRSETYDQIRALEDEWRRIRTSKLKNIPITTLVGGSPKETWLLKVLDIFKVVQRMNSIQPAGSKVSTSPSEHDARCHIAHLMDDCGWDRQRMHEAFSYADDYKHDKTERMINSLIGRR